MVKLKLEIRKITFEFLTFTMRNPKAATLIALIGVGALFKKTWEGSQTKFSVESSWRFELPKSKDSFIEKISGHACSEMEKYKIPASITIAQAIWESKKGQSVLSTKYFNLFGIKCGKKAGTCEKGHCVNVPIAHGVGDTREDLYLKHGNWAESIRAHSLCLKKEVYKNLFKLRIDDYKGWAKGLTGTYATDPNYGEGIIRVIEENDLTQFDKAVLNSSMASSN
jgi:flagellum-specific peptidoglycan hydrolase FlgJ